MNVVRQGWLVAKREMRERSRSGAFRASVVLMIVAVAAALTLPVLLMPGGGAKDVGLTGPAPPALAANHRPAGPRRRDRGPDPPLREPHGR
jgi:hypothetical protein